MRTRGRQAVRRQRKVKPRVRAGHSSYPLISWTGRQSENVEKKEKKKSEENSTVYTRV